LAHPKGSPLLKFHDGIGKLMIRYFSGGPETKEQGRHRVELKGFLTGSDRVVISAGPVRF